MRLRLFKRFALYSIALTHSMVYLQRTYKSQSQECDGSKKGVAIGVGMIAGGATPTIVPSKTIAPRSTEKTTRSIQSHRVGAASFTVSASVIASHLLQLERLCFLGLANGIAKRCNE